MRPAALIPIAALLGACATLSEEDCQAVDWLALGSKDGVSGFPQSRISDHGEACSRFELPVDRAAWLRGWEAGIQRYCTPQNGYDVGRQGDRYRAACPADLEAPFLASYRPAKRVADAEDRVSELEWAVDDLADEVRRLAASEDEAKRKKARALRRALRDERSALREARREDAQAREALLAFLARNPTIQP